jgi:hypothetical protein
LLLFIHLTGIFHLPAKYTHQRKDTAQTMRLKELCRQMEDAGQVNEKEQ